MKKPDPVPGLIVRYDYLWNDEAARGRQEGAKERPCAIVVARSDKGQETRVLMAPITHTPPADPKAAVEIPEQLKKHLGLDDSRSWIVTNELNSVAWGDPGIVPATSSRWEYGFLPPKLAKAATEQILEQQRRKQRIIDRVAIEKKRADEEGRGR